MRRKLISICIPVFNEEDNIENLYARVSSVLNKIADRYDYEFVFTDNHSGDRTFELLADLARKDKRVRAIRFSKNFGFQRSILTGFREARGDCAIQLDADLQDPPELIPDFVSHWEQGARVVYGIRRKREGDPWLTHRMRRAFYRFINALSEDELPHDAGDFRLVDRVILDVLRTSEDQTPYLRGQIAAMGYSQIGITYDRAKRTAGQSKFPVLKLVGLALDGILNHSVVPLRLATYAGLALTVLSIFGASYYLIGRLFFRQDWPLGLASLAILLFFLIGLNATFLGIIGEYVGRIYLNVKRQPLVLVEARIDAMTAENREP